MPSPRLKVFLLFICSLSFVWFVWSKSHSRNQVKTKFVVELYQFTVINVQVYFFPSKSTRIKRQFFDNRIQFITTKFHNIVENRDSLFYENCKNMRRSFSKQWKRKKHRAGIQFLLLLFKTILQRLGISTLGMDGTSYGLSDNGVLVWVQFNAINKSAFTPLSLARESLTFRRSEAKQKTCTKRHWFWWLMFNKAPL